MSYNGPESYRQRREELEAKAVLDALHSRTPKHESILAKRVESWYAAFGLTRRASTKEKLELLRDQINCRVLATTVLENDEEELFRLEKKLMLNVLTSSPKKPILESFIPES